MKNENKKENIPKSLKGKYDIDEPIKRKSKNTPKPLEDTKNLIYLTDKDNLEL